MGPIPTPGETKIHSAEKEVEEEKKGGEDDKDVEMSNDAEDKRQEVFSRANSVEFDKIGDVNEDVHGTHVHNKAIGEYIFSKRNFVKK